jgi:hypothetical protein
MSNVFAILGLLLCGGIIKSMETCKDISLISMNTYDQPSPLSNYYPSYSCDSTTTKKYTAHGVQNLLIDGSMCKEKNERIKLTLTQIIDNELEEVTVQTEKNSSSFVTVNHNGIDLEIGLRSTDQNSVFKDILIHIALKKYAKIITKRYVDTILSTIKLENIYLELKDYCSISTESNAHLIADVLEINNKGKSHVDLSINSKRLCVNNDNAGIVILNGVATEQDVVLFNGSFNGYNIESERASVVIGDGAGEILVSARKQITGYFSKKSDHETTFKIPRRSLYLEARDSIQPIDFEQNGELLYK